MNPARSSLQDCPGDGPDHLQPKQESGRDPIVQVFSARPGMRLPENNQTAGGSLLKVSITLSDNCCKAVTYLFQQTVNQEVQE